MKKFSIIIPAYKSADTLSKCLHSCIDQDWKEKEIIVVLDSLDNSSDLVLKAFPDVKVLKTEHERSGAPRARNIGFENSTGDYILFLDADSYLSPGSLRTFAEEFEENQYFGFLYAGYKIRPTSTSGAVAYPSEEFDLYHLERYNFIDTSNPIRREFVVSWDEELKSLQDWDFWLRVCQSGIKGKFLKNAYFVEKEAPKKASISQDSHDNWVERRLTIQKKLNLPISDVAVTSQFVHHGRRVAKLLGFDFVEPMILASKPHNYKLVYMLGAFPENGVNNFLPFFDSKTNKFKEGLVKVVHWIGTDVLHTRTMMTFGQLAEYTKGFNARFIQYCQSEANEAELKGMGFNVKCIPLPVETAKKQGKEPGKFTVAIYDHGTSQDDIYCQTLMKDIIVSTPDIEFIYFGSDIMKGKDGNVRFLGRVDIDSIINSASVLLRISRHDGLPVTPVEFMQAGKPTITNVNMPYTYRVEFDGVINEDTVPKVKTQIIKAIRDVKNRRVEPINFEEALKHYGELLSPARMKEELLKKIEENNNGKK